jgi:DNA-binding response OmpR family regulator
MRYATDMPPHPHILLVDDETAIAEVAEYALREHGFEVRLAADGDTALELFRRDPPDLVLLDLNLPGLGGLELLQRMRALRPAQAVIMVTSRVQEADRVLGLEMGADDYVTKPFSPRELVARAKAVLRRRIEPAARGGVRRHGLIELDEDAFALKVAGTPVALSRGEFALLGALLRNPARAFTRDQLLDTMHGADAGAVTDRSVDAAIRRIRKKFDEARPGLDPIDTLYGVGYKLRAGLEDSA